jgi:hypothetical protein
VNLPWRRPRRETLLLALVAAVALSPVYHWADPDVSRLCLTRAMEHGQLAVGSCIGDSVDRAEHGGKIYSDKAPGISMLAVPIAAAERLPPPAKWKPDADLRVWLIRLLLSGTAFVFLVFAIGRIAEGLASGTGPLAIVAFGLGTLVSPLAATLFGHVTSGALAFGAFLLAMRGRPALAGLAAGAAIVVEYQTAAIALVVALYIVAENRRELLRFVAGAIPPLILLAVYNTAAFGSPFRFSYQYVANRYAKEQASGLLGVHLPTASATRAVLVGQQGLIVVSPVLVAAAAGLVLLGRRHPREALVCAVVTIVFVAANCGYFLPYGGTSPGPRFLAPALPFLAVGLGPAIARWRAAVAALAAASIAATTALVVSWPAATTYRDTVWGELARAVTQGTHSRIATELTKNLVVWLGLNRLDAAVAVALVAAAAFVAAVTTPARR